MHLGFEAFLWGIASAVSLPLGALVGLLWEPRKRTNSAFMAFGAGALMFALTIELFGQVPQHVHAHGPVALIAAVVGAIAGGLLFDGMNQLLNNYGAFLRQLGNARKYVTRLKIQRTQNLARELRTIKVLRHIAPQPMALLMRKLDRLRFKAGALIFKQGDFADAMYFIVSGQVEVILHNPVTGEAQEQIAVLQEGDTFGELGIVNKEPRTADAKALTEVRVYTIQRHDFEELLPMSPELQQAINDLAGVRMNELAIKWTHGDDKQWEKETFSFIENTTLPASAEEIREEGRANTNTAGGAAVAIWLGILIDGIPESLVIGMLATSATGMSLAFIAGVFIANFPEAMSSSVGMKAQGMGFQKILLMWSSICIISGIGAFVGSFLFLGEPVGHTLYFVLGIEGLAAGAMLTMIAETMLPEAFEQGGAIVGLSTLSGFLTALVVKVI